MNWSNAFLLALAVLSCVWVQTRIERNRWWVGVFFYTLPVLLLTALWASVTASWPEAAAGAAAGLGLGAGWWLAYGRRVRPADSSGIKVWGQDTAARPKAALQAELDQLKYEEEQLEAELRRLRETQAKKPDEGEVSS